QPRERAGREIAPIATPAASCVKIHCLGVHPATRDRSNQSTPYASGRSPGPAAAAALRASTPKGRALYDDFDRRVRETRGPVARQHLAVVPEEDDLILELIDTTDVQETVPVVVQDDRTGADRKS